MLKPPEPAGEEPDRPIGELVHELVEHGKAYANAEIGLAKAIAAAKARILLWSSGVFLLALIVVQSAVTILAITLYAALYWALGTILAGIAAFLVFAAVAGGLAWYAVQRVRREL